MSFDSICDGAADGAIIALPLALSSREGHCIDFGMELVREIHLRVLFLTSGRTELVAHVFSL